MEEAAFLANGFTVDDTELRDKELYAGAYFPGVYYGNRGQRK